MGKEKGEYEFSPFSKALGISHIKIKEGKIQDRYKERV